MFNAKHQNLKDFIVICRHGLSTFRYKKPTALGCGFFDQRLVQVGQRLAILVCVQLT